MIAYLQLHGYLIGRVREVRYRLDSGQIEIGCSDDVGAACYARQLIGQRVEARVTEMTSGDSCAVEGRLVVLEDEGDDAHLVLGELGQLQDAALLQRLCPATSPSVPSAPMLAL